MTCRWEFESIGKAGSRLGTALAMAVDHEIGMVSLVRNLEEFFAPRILRLVYAMPRRVALERENSARAGARRRPAGGYRDT
nr:NADH dehydrogenase I chain F [Salmonella sp. NCTC 7297]